MNVRTTMVRLSAAIILTAGAALPRGAAAQAYAYPSFQQPRITAREYNVAIADGRAVPSSLVFQWREGVNARQQLSLDVGFADPGGRNSTNVFFLGGQFAQQLATASTAQPLDVLFTAGVNGAFGNNASLFRLPVGVSIGHRFLLERGLAIAPYVHPRASIDRGRYDDGDGNRVSSSKINIDLDLGASLELTPQLAVRLSALLGSSDTRAGGDAIGLALAWTPTGLRR